MDDKTRLRNRERIEQSKREIDRLVKEFEAWLARRTKADEQLQQYSTQLKVIGALLTQASVRLREQIDATSPALPSGLVYSQCRTHDLRTAWLRSVWTYYQSRFDQRDHPDCRVRKVLAAADEVVWSCYAEAFRNAAKANPAIQRGSAPLPYFEPRFSPEAIPRDDPPRDLGSNVDGSFLGDFLKQLPVPLVIIPPYCYDAPWWLIYIAHEIGHHVQFDLLPDRGAEEAYEEVIAAALRPPTPAQLDPIVAARWVGWNQELFADAFSVATVGGAAAWAMAELEAQREAAMVTPKTRYPAPAVRLQIMVEMSRLIGAAAGAPVLPIDPCVYAQGPAIMQDGEDLRQAAAADLQRAKPVAQALLRKPLAGVTTVEKLGGWRAAQSTNTITWRKILLGKEPRVQDPKLETPRIVAAAGIAAWAEVSGEEDDAKREARRAELSNLLPDILIENREEGTRAADETATPATGQLGDKLAEQLLHASDEELGV